VGTALIRLLDHVEVSMAARQASETRLRRFGADASHELRTPVTSIRGYTELVRRRGGLPEEVDQSLRRVESEAVRMSGLVDDLLLLARLDAGRELCTGTVDLTALVVDVVSDAHAAGPAHSWRVDLPGAPVLVPGDAGRLHQVLANLLANVRTHTPPRDDGDPEAPGRRGLGPAAGRRRRPGHPRCAARRRLRAVRPRGRRPVAGDRQHRARAGDRPGGRLEARRRRDGRLRARAHRLHRPAAVGDGRRPGSRGLGGLRDTRGRVAETGPLIGPGGAGRL
jgi:hypothetical protein